MIIWGFYFNQLSNRSARAEYVVCSKNPYLRISTTRNALIIYKLDVFGRVLGHFYSIRYRLNNLAIAERNRLSI